MPFGDRIYWMARDDRLSEGGSHVHDDARTHAIDAVFGLISDQWSSETNSFLIEPCRALPGAVIHPTVTYMHDWIEFFRPYVYNS
eukprot:4470257-Pleurochrysis_carterae.AAC.1